MLKTKKKGGPTMVKKKKVNNPWGRAGKPGFAVKVPDSSFLKQANRGFGKFLESPFKKGK
jgi:hypothetical protein